MSVQTNKKGLQHPSRQIQEQNLYPTKGGLGSLGSLHPTRKCQLTQEQLLTPCENMKKARDRSTSHLGLLLTTEADRNKEGTELTQGQLLQRRLAKCVSNLGQEVDLKMLNNRTRLFFQIQLTVQDSVMVSALVVE